MTSVRKNKFYRPFEDLKSLLGEMPQMPPRGRPKASASAPPPLPTTPDEERRLFKKAMAGVTPIGEIDRIDKEKQGGSSLPAPGKQRCGCHRPTQAAGRNRKRFRRGGYTGIYGGKRLQRPAGNGSTFVPGRFFNPGPHRPARIRRTGCPGNAGYFFQKNGPKRPESSAGGSRAGPVFTEKTDFKDPGL